MKRLDITTKIADFKAGKYVEQKTLAVVASTKSENILREEIAKTGAVITECKTKDFFLDKAKTRTAIESLVNEQMGNTSAEFNKAVVLHLMESLDRHCVFYNPKK